MNPKKIFACVREIALIRISLPRVKREISVPHFSAFDGLRLSFVGSFVILAAMAYFIAKGTEERATVRALSRSLQVMNRQLRTAQYQKVEMENLVNKKTVKLEEHLNQMKEQEQEIRQLVERKHSTSMMVPQRAAFVSLKMMHEMEQSRFGRKSSRGVSYHQLTTRLSSLERHISSEQSILDQIKILALERREEMLDERRRWMASFDRIPSLWPTDGEVTSTFGYRVHPIDGEGEFHPGVDIATNYGSPIRAAASGTCIFADYKNGFGLTVLIDHGNNFITQYSHCSQILARPGSITQKGEIIARVGSTGYSTGPHVHYEVHYQNSPINPAEFLGLTIDRLTDRGGIAAIISPRN